MVCCGLPQRLPRPRQLGDEAGHVGATGGDEGGILAGLAVAVLWLMPVTVADDQVADRWPLHRLDIDADVSVVVRPPRPWRSSLGPRADRGEFGGGQRGGHLACSKDAAVS